MQGPVRSVIRAVPIAALKPMISVSEAVGQALLGCYNSLLLSVATFDYSSVIKVTFARMADEISDDAWDVLNGSGMGQGSESFSRFVRM